MKKIMLMLLAAICICSNVKAQITPDQYAILTIKDVELKAGEVRELEINMKNPIAVTAVTSDIILPEGCSFEQYYNEEDDEYYDLEMTGRKHSTHSVATNHVNGAANHLRFMMSSSQNKNVRENDGALIKFKIKVGEDMQPGKYEIQLAGQDIVTADEQQANEYGYTTKSTLTIKPNEFTVTIKDAANGTVTGAATYPTGSEVTLTATADEGYKFVKWSNEITDNPYKFNITEDIELSAIFEACKYTITYVVDGETYKTAELSFGAKITPEAAPEKEGYKFSGWSELPETMPAKDVTVTGTFAANVYTITYVVDGETYKTVEVAFGEKITPEAAPAKEGYKFSGWSELPETMPAKDVTVTGTFEIIIAVNEIISSDKKVDVYNQNGIRIYKQVYVKEALQRLPKGIYFINGQKIYKQ